MNILFVENHARFARLTAQQFLSSHCVTIVPSLQEARNALVNARFDAVLLDYDLDDGKGTELFAALHDLPQRPFVIATSSHQAGNDALLAAGADDVCSKMQFQEIESLLVLLRQQ